MRVKRAYIGDLLADEPCFSKTTNNYEPRGGSVFFVRNASFPRYLTEIAAIIEISETAMVLQPR